MKYAQLYVARRVLEHPEEVVGQVVMRLDVLEMRLHPVRLYGHTRQLASRLIDQNPSAQGFRLCPAPYPQGGRPSLFFGARPLIELLITFPL